MVFKKIQEVKFCFSIWSFQKIWDDILYFTIGRFKIKGGI